MFPSAQLNFVRQQGFPDTEAAASGTQYAALMFQPRVVGVLVLVGLISQAPVLFLALSAVLIWNVLVPSRNPFDVLYNRLVAGPRGLPPLPAAPAPRRFAQGMAATFMLGIGLSLLNNWQVLAWVLEGALVVALGALILGRFCLGSYLYLLLRGQGEYAHQTLPWHRGE
jgi:hypothetical protein